MAQTIEQIVAELDNAYRPQVDLIQKQLAELPAYYQAQEQGLNVARENAFRDITGQANQRGVLYSGMPIQEQTRYTGERYLPALAGLKRQQSEQTTNYQSRINDIRSRQYQQAQSVRQNQLQNELQAQIERERIAAQQRQAASRVSGGRSGGGGGSSAKPTRADYNADLKSIEAAMQNRGQVGSYENMVRQFVQTYAKYGISPQEIGETLYNTYGRYGPRPGKKFYG